MKIKIQETFSHETGCYIYGRTYTVAEQLGEEWTKAGLADDMTPQPAKKAEEPKAEPKKSEPESKGE